jgi:hypothetical protein
MATRTLRLDSPGGALMPFNRGTRHKPKWVGHVKYNGRKKWVGSHYNMEDYRKAEERCLAELREEVDNPPRRVTPTVLKFAAQKSTRTAESR